MTYIIVHTQILLIINNYIIKSVIHKQLFYDTHIHKHYVVNDKLSTYYILLIAIQDNNKVQIILYKSVINLSSERYTIHK